MRPILTIMNLFLSFGCVYAQQYETVAPEKVFKDFSEMAKVYGKTDYSLSYQRIVYKNEGDAEAMLTEKGAIYRGKENEYRVESPGSLTIQNNALKLVVDSNLRVVSIFKTDTLFQAIDMSQFMNKNVTERYSFKRMQSGNTVRYLMTPKSTAEGTTEIWINTADFTIARIEMLMPKANYFSESMDDESMEAPKLIAIYNKPQPLPANRSAIFNVGEIIENKNNQLVLLPKAKGFELHDSRVLTK